MNNGNTLVQAEKCYRSAMQLKHGYILKSDMLTCRTPVLEAIVQVTLADEMLAM